MLNPLKMKKSPVTFIDKKPKLKSPYLIAGWPGMGNVAMGVIQHLQEQTDAVAFAKIEPGDSFQCPSVLVSSNIIQALKSPQSLFYYCRPQNTQHDIILFAGDAQPVPGRELYLGQIILDLFKKFKGFRVYTCAALPKSIHHRESPKVWAVSTHEALTGHLRQFPLNIMSSGQISGMNGLLLGMAKRENLEGVCLLAEIPHYTIHINNPKSSMAILKILSPLLGIPMNFEKLEELAHHTENEIDTYIQQIRDDLGKELSLKNKEKPEYLH